ncbi:MAG: hypothetical protein AB7E55_36175 [Pigmentiphaga sp.]
MGLNIVFNVVALMAVSDAPAMLLAGLGLVGGEVRRSVQGPDRAEGETEGPIGGRGALNKIYNSIKNTDKYKFVDKFYT